VGQKPKELLLQGGDPAGKSPLQGPQGLPPGQLPFRLYEGQNGLRLGQVQLAVEVGPQGELSPPGGPRPQGDQDLHHPPQDRRGAVGLELHQVLPGVGVGRPEDQKQGLVNDLPRGGVHHLPQGEAAALEAPRVLAPEGPGGQLQGPLPGKPHHPDGPLAGGRGDGADGVLEGHATSKLDLFPSNASSVLQDGLRKAPAAGMASPEGMGSTHPSSSGSPKAVPRRPSCPPLPAPGKGFAAQHPPAAGILRTSLWRPLAGALGHRSRREAGCLPACGLEGAPTSQTRVLDVCKSLSPATLARHGWSTHGASGHLGQPHPGGLRVADRRSTLLPHRPL
jgi:hypothetical protein